MSNDKSASPPEPRVKLPGRLGKLTRVTIRPNAVASAVENQRHDVAYGASSAEQIVHAFDVRERANKAARKR